MANRTARKAKAPLARQVRVSEDQWSNLKSEAASLGMEPGRYLDMVLTGLGKSKRYGAWLVAAGSPSL